jgi:hypothetical protein
MVPKQMPEGTALLDQWIAEVGEERVVSAVEESAKEALPKG